MPIKSYLAIPAKGRKALLEKDLSHIPECEVTLSDNKDLLVIVTDTEDEQLDRQLFAQLNNLENLQMLTLVAAFSNDAEVNG